MRKTRFTVNYSRLESRGGILSVGAFSLRVQAEKTLQILAANPSFVSGEIVEEYVEAI